MNCTDNMFQVSLMPHNEDSNANSFYDGIYVAKEDVYETDWWGNPLT